jgi:hypothetical protein
MKMKSAIILGMLVLCLKNGVCGNVNLDKNITSIKLLSTASDKYVEFQISGVTDRVFRMYNSHTSSFKEYYALLLTAKSTGSTISMDSTPWVAGSYDVINDTYSNWISIGQ